MKKALSLLMAFVMVIAGGLISYGEPAEEETGSITIKNPVVNESYYIYRIFDLESYDEESKAYSYTINEKWKTFALREDIRGKYISLQSKDDTTYYVNWISGANVADFAKEAIKWAKESETDVVDGGCPTTATNLVFENLPLGYYLVDSSVGALCSLTTTNPDAEVTEKNELSTIIKKVKEDFTGDYQSENSAQIGETVEFKSEITIGEGAENLKVHDVMDPCLTLDKTSFVLKIDEKEVESATNYTVKTEGFTDNTTFVIEFNDSFVSKLSHGTVIQIFYKAKVGTGATEKTDGALNDTWISFGDSLTSTHSTTKTHTYSVHIIKTDDNKKVIKGAEFYLYDSKTEGNIIPVVKVSEDDEKGVYKYRAATPEDQITGNGDPIKAGFAIVEGLDGDVIYLEESKQPSGFNKLAERLQIDLRGGSILSGLDAETLLQSENGVAGTDVSSETGVIVVNKSGTELPSTGGVGTSLFYAVGGSVVLASLAVLIFKKRTSEI